MKIDINLIEIQIRTYYLYSKIYFSNPFSANKRCVSVMDIFSKVFNVIGIGSDALSIRNCDIK